MNRLFVANKPIFMSSNRFLQQLKRKYDAKKAGFSGTLDPFATGTLIVAMGSYTKLLPYLNKSPKRYRATLWLGATSPSLDIENIEQITSVSTIDEECIAEAVTSLKGTLTYTPPHFSAKHIGGKRAYELAREGVVPQLKEITSTVYESRLIHINHPFITFELTVSEGAYIRSLAQIVAKRLNTQATLSALTRLQEGAFVYENEKPLDPLKCIDLPINAYLGNTKELTLGKKLRIQDFAIQDEGLYVIKGDRFFSIMEIKEGRVSYKLNKIPQHEGA